MPGVNAQEKSAATERARPSAELVQVILGNREIFRDTQSHRETGLNL